MKLIVRVPCQREITRETAQWLLWLQKERPDVDIDLVNTKGWGVAWGRNEIVKSFLSSEATHLWMIDSDTVPPESMHLLDHADDYPAITGLYLGHTFKGLRYHLYKETKPYEWTPIHPQYVSQERMMKVDASGAGCMLLRRDLFDEWQGVYFTFGRDEQGNPVGEDLLFGKRIGGLMADTHYVCNHFRQTDLNRAWLNMRSDFTQRK